MKPILHTLVIALFATVAFAPAQEAPRKEKENGAAQSGE